MRTALQPWQVLVAAMAGWLARRQEAAVEYLREGNRVLKEQVGRRRLRLSEAARRRFASRGKEVGRHDWTKIASISSPHTKLRFYHRTAA